MTHNQLQSKCFLWVWNEYPYLRGLLFSVTNNLTTSLKGRAGAARMAEMKSLGVVKGTTDFIFYFKGRMYAWDIKVGHDKLRPEQIAFINKVKEQGGDGGEIRSFEEFKEMFRKITGE
ncbi:MAG: hypothetical protein ACKOW2_02485 [Sphingobacteriaceae bacterium]